MLRVGRSKNDVKGINVTAHLKQIEATQAFKVKHKNESSLVVLGNLLMLGNCSGWDDSS